MLGMDRGLNPALLNLKNLSVTPLCKYEIFLCLIVLSPQDSPSRFSSSHRIAIFYRIIFFSTPSAISLRFFFSIARNTDKDIGGNKTLDLEWFGDKNIPVFLGFNNFSAVYSSQSLIQK